MSAAIEVCGLVVTYGQNTAVRDLDLTVEEGEIVGFLGPNGAGKTTTIEVLEGYRTRDAGVVRVLGEDPETAPLSWRENIGIVLQESQIDSEFTCLEATRMHAACFQEPRRPQEVLEIVGLGDAANQRAATLSGGQLRRLDLALALVGNPRLVFLDEPTTGFDPAARRESWSMLNALRDHGHTVLLTTHYMDEAEHLGDRIVVISDGHVLATGTAEDLAHQVSSLPRISWEHQGDGAELPGRFGAVVEGSRFVVETDDVFGVLSELTKWANAHDAAAAFQDLQVDRPSLEDTYMKLISTGTGTNGR